MRARKSEMPVPAITWSDPRLMPEYWNRLRNSTAWPLLKTALGVAVAALLLHLAPALVSARADSRAETLPVYVSDSSPAQTGVQALAAQAPAVDSPPVLSTVQVRSELAIPHWLRPGEFAWNDEGVPPGETVLVVNIRARILSVYRDGVEIGRSSLIYGADDKPTPTGTFPVLEKDADHVSNLYDAPMPHMLRLTWDGVAIHGSAELRDDAATRGCVGLPREFAALLFDVVRVGDRVIVWDGVTPA